MGIGEIIGNFIEGYETATSKRKTDVDEVKQEPVGAFTGIKNKDTSLGYFSSLAKDVDKVYNTDYKAKIAKTANGLHSYLQSKEGKDNSYDTKNAAGSSAYGKYQFMPSTAKEIASKIGIDPNQWQEPENQERIMNYAKQSYIDALDRWGVEPNEKNQYVIHQLGSGRANRYFKGKLTDKDVNVMNYNLPDKYKATDRNLVIETWAKLYNEDEYRYGGA